MEQVQATKILISDIPYREEKKITIGNNVYLIGKGFVGERKEILYTEDYYKKVLIESRADHLLYSGMFIIRDKLLTVEVAHYISYGPLGERINMDVHYNDEKISNYRSLRSYMGGGANGKWPTIKNNDWNLIFNLKTESSNNSPMNISIEYYENIIPDNCTTDTKKNNSFNSLKVSDEILKNKFQIEALGKIKSWEIDVCDDISNETGTLICYRYPGHQKYCVYTYAGWRKVTIDQFIGYSLEEDLYSLEYKTNGLIQELIPWGEAEIYVDKTDARFDLTIYNSRDKRIEKMD